MSENRIITVVCGVVAAAGLTGAGAALAHAATVDTTTATSSATTSTSARGWGADPLSSHGPSRDTAVTGTELAKVKAAVKSKDSSVTVRGVRQDPDGSYDVFGLRSGAPVMLELSKDLSTINVFTGGPGDGHHLPGPGGGDHTPVTGAELAKVKAAVRSKDSSVTVSSVRQDPDGSYDVFGTRFGAPVMLEVSRDLKTVSTAPQRPQAPQQPRTSATTQQQGTSTTL